MSEQARSSGARRCQSFRPSQPEQRTAFIREVSVDAGRALSMAASLAKKAEGLLKAVLGPPAGELGGLLKDKVSARRYRNLLRIAARAKEQLDVAGLSPKEVPLAIIHPLLENASLEVDDDLQKRWAALLANAAASRSEAQVPPYFVEILKQLTALEARFLDKAYDETLQPPQHKPQMLPRPRRHPILEGTLGQLKPSMIGNLERLGLVTRHSHDLSNFTSYLGRNVMGATNHLYVSDLGMDFVRACRPPAEGPRRLPHN
jgi:hypothetical protein